MARASSLTTVYSRFRANKVQFAELLNAGLEQSRLEQRENFCDQATKCNTVNALALRGDEGRSKLR